jgi:hypothetical protein
MPFVWSAQITQTAVELWNAGKTGSEIAQIIHAPSRDSVTRKISRLRAQGIPIAPRSPPIRPVPLSIEPRMFAWTAEKTQTAIDLWNAGKSSGQIARAIGAPSRGSVTKKIYRLRDQGIPLHLRPSPIRAKPVDSEAGAFVWTAERVQTAIDLWNAGRTGSEIAQAIHAPSRHSVRWKIGRLRRQGLPVQSRPSPILSQRAIGAEIPDAPSASLARSDGPVSLTEAGFRQCRYPLWERQSDPKLVCGKETLTANSSWCEQHHTLVFPKRRHLREAGSDGQPRLDPHHPAL